MFQLALIGGGRIGTFHAEAAAPSAAVEIAAVVDPLPAPPAAVHAPDARLFASVGELLASGVAVDGALVAVPTRLHRETIAALVDAGIPVLSEKPCGMDPDEVEAIGAHVAARGGLLRVAYWRRFVPELRAIADAIQAGAYGGVYTVYTTQWDGTPPPASFRDPHSSGGLAKDCGVHDFDLLRWLLGQEIVDVAGFGSPVLSDVEVPGDVEAASFVARMSGGATGIVCLGRRHPPGELQSLQVFGTQDAIYLPYVEQAESAMVFDAFRHQLEDFAAFVGGGATRTADLADAAAALRAAAQATARMLVEPV